MIPGAVALEAGLPDLRYLVTGPLLLGFGLLGPQAVSLLQLSVNNFCARKAEIQGGTPPWPPTIRLTPACLLPMLLAAFVPWAGDALTREGGRGQNPWGGACRPTRRTIAPRDQASFVRILRERLGERTEVLEVSQAALMWTQRLNLVATVGAGMAHAGNLEGEKAMFELGERGAGLRPTLQCLGGKDIGLSPLQGGAEWRMEADPLQVEEAPGNLVANGRDAMAG